MSPAKNVIYQISQNVDIGEDITIYGYPSTG
jgi:hypothetical protein